MSADHDHNFAQLCELTAKALREMPPAERDRFMQENLAAARGPTRNFDLLCQMTASVVALRRSNTSGK